MDLNSKVSTIQFVGSYFVKKLKVVKIETIEDLIYHTPRSYDDFSQNSTILETQEGEKVTIQGQVISIKNIFTRSGKKIQRAQVSDGLGVLEVIWFNQTYLTKTLPIGTWVSLSGKLELTGKKRAMIAPKYEKVPQSTLSSTIHTGRLVPIYPETSGLSSKWIRSRISSILPTILKEIQEYLPEEIRNKENLIPLPAAIEKIHFPKNYQDVEVSRKRLAFDEFFKLQLNALHRKESWKKKNKAFKMIKSKKKVLSFLKTLPFFLTNSQNKALEEILENMGNVDAMNRLLQGDVGSGKTVVAGAACYFAYLNGFQSVFMAPTQILASQHYKTLKNLLEPFGLNIYLILSGKQAKEKQLKHPDILIGTHALLHRPHIFDNVAFLVIDEQHRFGVSQRALLTKSNKGKSPHVLTMTATPIPRTVALTIYGDLDLSILDEMPTGRQIVKTWIVPPQKRANAYLWIEQEIRKTKSQAFIVCPLIEESDKETMKSVKAATAEFNYLKENVFSKLKLGLLHGKIKYAEKEKVMQNFKKGKIDILVATPVVEVGIDIPNATIMLIETAERFGLAQLHQLRGRVGRGVKQSYCLLMTESKSEKVQTRLRALEKNFSGAKLAEIDLQMRGPGEVYGTAQSGFPELKIGDYSDLELISSARKTAQEMLPQLKTDLKLKNLINKTSEIAPN